MLENAKHVKDIEMAFLLGESPTLWRIPDFILQSCRVIHVIKWAKFNYIEKLLLRNPLLTTTNLNRTFQLIFVPPKWLDML